MNDDTEHTDPTDIDRHIAVFARYHALSSRYLDRHWHDLSVRELARCVADHAQNAVLLARLLRDRPSIGLRGPPPVDLDPTVADLKHKLARLSCCIDEIWVDRLDDRVCRLLDAYSLGAVRLGRLLVHRKAIQQQALREEADDFERDLHQALAVVGAQLGVELV